jgi:hypothetical protein
MAQTAGTMRHEAAYHAASYRTKLRISFKYQPGQ